MKVIEEELELNIIYDENKKSIEAKEKGQSIALNNKKYYNNLEIMSNNVRQRPLTNNTSSSKSIQNQQIEELTYTIEIKEKKIIYLEQQLRSVKEESTRKLEKKDSEYERLRKENESLQRKMICEKEQSALEWGEKIKAINENSRENASQKEEFYQNLLKQKEIRSFQLISEFESRYDNLITQLKQENERLQNILLSKSNNLSSKKQENIAMTFGSKDQYNNFDKKEGTAEKESESPELENHSSPSEFMKEKLSLMQDIFTYKQKCEKLTRELENEKRLNKKLESESDRSKREFEETISMLKVTIQKLEEKVLFHEKQRTKETQHYEQKFIDFEEQNEQLKAHLKESDETYLKLLEFKANQQSPEPLTTIKSCNHAGLISQMEKNLELKNNEIEVLKEKLSEWERIFGFDKNIDERLTDVGNVSSRTEKVYKNQKEKLSTETDKLNKKGGIRTNR